MEFQASPFLLLAFIFSQWQNCNIHYILFQGKYSGGSVNMWNRTGQPDQENMSMSSQHQSHAAHSSMHPPQPMQSVAQEKNSSTGKLACVCITQFRHEHIHIYALNDNQFTTVYFLSVPHKLYQKVN